MCGVTQYRTVNVVVCVVGPSTELWALCVVGPSTELWTLCVCGGTQHRTVDVVCVV